METKLTLKLNSGAIKRAKNYIRTHKGNSLSKLVEKYFESLTTEENEKVEKKMTPIVSSLAGVIKHNKIKDIKDEYTEYLKKKYE